MTDNLNLTPEKVAELLAAAEAAENEPHLDCDPVPVIDGLALRRVLGRKEWGVPQPHGCCGWVIDGLANGARSRIIVTGDHASDAAIGVQWVHASISHPTSTPNYYALKLLHRAVFGDGWAYQVFAPSAEHINIHARALHLFGRRDGLRALPDFGRHGTI